MGSLRRRPGTPLPGTQDPNTIAWDCANANVCSGDQGNTTLISSLSNPFPNGVVPTITAPTGLANNLGNSLSTMLHSQRTPDDL